jgi:hypothetical protein
MTGPTSLFHLLTLAALTALPACAAHTITDNID